MYFIDDIHFLNFQKSAVWSELMNNSDLIRANYNHDTSQCGQLWSADISPGSSWVQNPDDSEDKLLFYDTDKLKYEL